MALISGWLGDETKKSAKICSWQQCTANLCGNNAFVSTSKILNYQFHETNSFVTVVFERWSPDQSFVNLLHLYNWRIRVYALSETFSSYVPPENKIKMVYALKCPLAPDFGEITYEWCISLFGVVHLKLNKVSDNHKWKINYLNLNDEFLDQSLASIYSLDSTTYLPPFTLVLTEGAHIAKKNKVTKKWNDVNDHFFNQNETQGLKAELYKKDYQRIKLYDVSS